MSKIEMSGIKSSIISIHKVLKTQLEAVVRYKKNVSELTASDQYNSDYISRRIHELTQDLEAYAQKDMNSLETFLDKILRDSEDNASVFSMDDPKLQAAIQLINTVGGGIDYETSENMVKTFIGNQQSLIMLRSLFQAKEIDTKEVKKYIFLPEDKINDMRALVWAITSDVGSSMINIVKLSQKLKEYATLNGIELSEADTNIGMNYDDFYTTYARAAMGLPIE